MERRLDIQDLVNQQLQHHFPILGRKLSSLPQLLLSLLGLNLDGIFQDIDDALLIVLEFFLFGRLEGFDLTFSLIPRILQSLYSV